MVVVPGPEQQVYELLRCILEVPVEEFLQFGRRLSQGHGVPDCARFVPEHLEIVLQVELPLVSTVYPLVPGNLNLVLGVCVEDNYRIAVLLDPYTSPDIVRRHRILVGFDTYDGLLVHIPVICLEACHRHRRCRSHCIQFLLNPIPNLLVLIFTYAYKILIRFIQRVEVVPVCKGKPADHLHGLLDMPLLVTRPDVAEHMPESVVCFKLHELSGRLLLADKTLYSRPHVIIYHLLWDAPEIVEAFDVCFHHGLFVLTSEQSSPPAVAAECDGCHVE